MEIKDTFFYTIVRPIISIYVKICYRPQVIGKENIPKTGRVILAGNHTKWLDPVTLVGIQKRRIVSWFYENNCKRNGQYSCK